MSGREVELVVAQDLSPSVRYLRFRCCDGEPLVYVAGQWVNLWLDVSGVQEKRAYSLAGLPNHLGPGELELAVTRVDGGAMSQALHRLPVGARCRIDGPHGFFTRMGYLDEPAVFVGTGTGVCPLRAMLQEGLARGGESGPSLTLLFGCRSERDILFRDEWESLAQRYPRFTLHVSLSRPEGDWPGMTGYVQTHLAEVIEPGLFPHVFICGLTPMVKAVRAVLKDELGYGRKHIHSERFD